MTEPIRCYLFADSILPTTALHSSEEIAGATPANLDDERPGVLMELGSSFVIKAGVNDYFQIENDDSSETVAFTVDSGGYSGAELAAWLQAETSAQFVLAGYADPAMLASYSSTTRKFTITSTANIVLYWAGANPRQNEFATVLGYDNAANDGPGTSFVGDDETFVQGFQFCAWDTAQVSGDPEAIMLYGGNLGPTDTITLCTHPTDLGTNPWDWDGAAMYTETLTCTGSELNDLYIWLPSVEGLHNPMRYVYAYWTRGGSQATMPNAKMGVGGVWSDAYFDAADYPAEPNYQTPWQLLPISADGVVYSPHGGGSHINAARGRVDAVLMYDNWPIGIYKRFERFWDHKGRAMALWIPDVDNIYPAAGYIPNAVYGRISQWNGARLDNPEDDVSWSMRIHGEPMAPKGVL